MNLAPTVAGAMALGFLGSLHCTVMCGPLALAGCHSKAGLSRRSVALYFGGRLLSYAFAGAAFGAAGAHLACWIHLEIMERVLLVVVATAALVRGVRLLGAMRPTGLVRIGRPAAWRRAGSLAASLVPRRPLSLGLVTGALPCALLAGGWALAAATGDAASGALVMCAFSAATAPALAASLVLERATGWGRWFYSPRWQGMLWCALALWIAARSILVHGAHHGGH
jgi:sulfite exporter TauE/SafE